jgi:hypothetical protein
MTERLNVFLAGPDTFVSGPTKGISPVSEVKQHGALIGCPKEAGL